MDTDMEFTSDMEMKCVCFGIPVGIEDLKFRGHCRIELAPLVPTPPFFGAVSASFMEMPEIDFNLTGIGNLAEAPGIYKIFKNTMNQIFSNMLVAPDNFKVPLLDKSLRDKYNLSMADLLHPFPKGLIYIHAKSGHNLVAKDSYRICGFTCIVTRKVIRTLSSNSVNRKSAQRQSINVSIRFGMKN